MTAKYDPDTGSASRWDSDTHHVFHQWTVKPFVGHRHRHETVHLRVVVEYHAGVGADLPLEARSEDSEKFPDDWGVVESIEVRDYGVEHRRRPEARWLQ
jgi:hypothetical protein